MHGFLMFSAMFGKTKKLKVGVNDHKAFDGIAILPLFKIL